MCTASIPRSQDPGALLTQYIAQVKTAIYVINSVQANNVSSSCADTGLIDKLNASGYEASTLKDCCMTIVASVLRRLTDRACRCETAIGTELFSNLQQASSDMQNALDGLNDLHSDGAFISHLSSCQNLNIDTLNEAGLDGFEIRQVICNVPSAISSVSTAMISNHASNSSRSAQKPLTTLVLHDCQSQDYYLVSNTQ